MKCSICMSTYDRPILLRRTLESIFSQSVPFRYEVIVVDDGSPGAKTMAVCTQFPVRYSRIERDPGFRNPAKARNAAYRMAAGEVVICQSDDVMHGPDAIRRLTEELRIREFLIATVWNVDEKMRPIGLRGYGERCYQIKKLTGDANPRPLFFLGSLWRKDLYAVGGNDEEFTEAGREDVWFADCLMHGIGLTPRYVDVLGYHQDHDRPSDLKKMTRDSSSVYDRKRRSAKLGQSPWTAAGGPWTEYSTPLPGGRLAPGIPRVGGVG